MSRAFASATSSTIRSSSMPATSSRTRTSSGRSKRSICSGAAGFARSSSSSSATRSRNAALRHAVHRHKLHKHVRFFGFVPDQTLAILYRLAACSCFPPSMKASACRRSRPWRAARPSSRRTSPRSLRSSAMRRSSSTRFQPEAIADAMRRVLSDPALRDDLRARGLDRARHFSWERSIRRVREILRRLPRREPRRERPPT